MASKACSSDSHRAQRSASPASGSSLRRGAQARASLGQRAMAAGLRAHVNGALGPWALLAAAQVFLSLLVGNVIFCPPQLLLMFAWFVSLTGFPLYSFLSPVVSIVLTPTWLFKSVNFPI